MAGTGPLFEGFNWRAGTSLRAPEPWRPAPIPTFGSGGGGMPTATRSRLDDAFLSAQRSRDMLAIQQVQEQAAAESQQGAMDDESWWEWILNSLSKPIEAVKNAGEAVGELVTGDFADAGRAAIRAVGSAVPFSETAMGVVLPESAERSVAEFLNPESGIGTGTSGNQFFGSDIRPRDLAAETAALFGQVKTNTDPTGGLFSEFGGGDTQAGLAQGISQDVLTGAFTAAELLLDPVNWITGGTGAAAKFGAKGATVASNLTRAAGVRAAREAPHLGAMLKAAGYAEDLSNPVALRAAAAKSLALDALTPGTPEYRAALSQVDAIANEGAQALKASELDFLAKPPELQAKLFTETLGGDNPATIAAQEALTLGQKLGAKSIVPENTWGGQALAGQRNARGGGILSLANRPTVEFGGLLTKALNRTDGSVTALTNEEAFFEGLTRLNEMLGAGSKVFKPASQTLAKWRAGELSKEEASKALVGMESLVTGLSDEASRRTLTGRIGRWFDDATTAIRRGFIQDADTAATQYLSLLTPQLRENIGAVFDTELAPIIKQVDDAVAAARAKGGYVEQDFMARVAKAVEGTADTTADDFTDLVNQTARNATQAEQMLERLQNVNLAAIRALDDDVEYLGRVFSPELQQYLLANPKARDKVRAFRNQQQGVAATGERSAKGKGFSEAAKGLREMLALPDDFPVFIDDIGQNLRVQAQNAQERILRSRLTNELVNISALKEEPVDAAAVAAKYRNELDAAVQRGKQIGPAIDEPTREAIKELGDSGAYGSDGISPASRELYLKKMDAVHQNVVKRVQTAETQLEKARAGLSRARGAKAIAQAKRKVIKAQAAVDRNQARAVVTQEAAKLPPVKKGFVRVFRGEELEGGRAATRMQRVAETGVPAGKWGTDDLEYATGYSLTDTGKKGRVMYMDIPAEVAEQARLINQPKEIQSLAWDDPKYLQLEMYFPEELAGEWKPFSETSAYVLMRKELKDAEEQLAKLPAGSPEAQDAAERVQEIRAEIDGLLASREKALAEAPSIAVVKQPKEPKPAATGTGDSVFKSAVDEIDKLTTERKAAADMFARASETVRDKAAKEVAPTTAKDLANASAKLDEVDAKLAGIVERLMGYGDSVDDVLAKVPTDAKAAFVRDRLARDGWKPRDGFVSGLDLYTGQRDAMLPNNFDDLVRVATTEIPMDVYRDFMRLNRVTNKPQFFLKSLDAINGLWRGFILSVPTSVVNDIAGNLLTALTLGGMDIKEVASGTRAYFKYVKDAGGKAANLMKKEITPIADEVIQTAYGPLKTSEVLRRLDALGLFDIRNAATQRGGMDALMATPQMQSGADALAKFLPMPPDSKLGRGVKAVGKGLKGVANEGFALRELNDNAHRAAKALQSIKAGKSLDDAIRDSRNIFFDYSDVTKMERDVARRITLFYTWTRKAIPTVLRQAVENPVRFKLMMLLTGAGANQDNTDMPDWAKRLPGLYLGPDENGLPRMLSMPGAMVNSATDMLEGDVVSNMVRMSNPLLKMGFERAFDRDLFTGDVIGFDPANERAALVEGRGADRAPPSLNILPQFVKDAIGFRAQTDDKTGEIDGYRIDPRFRWWFENALPFGGVFRTADLIAGPLGADERKGVGEQLLPLAGLRARSIPGAKADESSIRKIRELRDRIALDIAKHRDQPITVGRDFRWEPNMNSASGQSLAQKLEAIKEPAYRVATEQLKALPPMGRREFSIRRAEMIANLKINIVKQMFPGLGEELDVLTRAKLAHNMLSDPAKFSQTYERSINEAADVLSDDERALVEGLLGG